MKTYTLSLAAAISLFMIASSVQLFAQSDDELFGASAPLVTQSAPVTADAQQGLLKTESVKIGGQLYLDFGGIGNPYHWKIPMSGGDLLTPFATSNMDLYADARPKDDLRFFVKGNLAYSPTGNTGAVLKEAFADIQPINSIYVRAGKQTANWGTGYFFSPGNLLSRSTIDPENPTLDLEGPLAVKVQKPFGNNTGYLYFLLDDAALGGAMAVAPKGEWLVGTSEIALGGLWEPEKPWAATANITFPFSGFDIFAEGVIKGNEDKVFLVKDPSLPLGLSTETRKSTLFPLATAGFSWTKDDSEERFSLVLYAQYFYNGTGYADTSVFTDSPSAVLSLVSSGKISVTDLLQRGQHYGAASFSVNNILQSYTNSSGKTSVTLSWTRLNYITASVAYGYAYGRVGSEYASSGATPSVTLKVSLTQVTF
jgi:hypothetical protein